MTINTQKLRDFIDNLDANKTPLTVILALSESVDAIDAQTAEIARLREALKKCAAVCAGETFHKQGLIDALEAARAALAQEGS